MGSPEFAVPCLRALAARTEVLAVVCQPDKPAGRGLTLHPPAVKVAAQELGLPVLQPVSLRPDRSSFHQELLALAPELVVVVAYGKILPQLLLDIPPRGCWNVHASILPRYRGAAPIQWALLRGETTTGVTLMQMDAGMDTGPTLMQRELTIADSDTSGVLFQRLSGLGAELLDQGLGLLAAGALPAPCPQDHPRATMAPLLDKEHGRVDFHRDAALVSGQLRGVDPWPGAYTMIDNRGAAAPLATSVAGAPTPLKLFGASVLGEGAGPPGAVLGVDARGLRVACGRGAVLIAELQLPGRKRLPAQAAWSGLHLPLGTILDLDPATGAATRNPRLDG